MTTAFAGIRAAVIALATTATVAPAAYIYRGSTPAPVPEQAKKALAVRLRDTDGALLASYGAPTDWDTVIEIELFARADGASDADTQLDAMLAALGAAIAGDSTLGGLVGDIRVTRVEWSDEHAAEKLASCICSCTVLHRTANQSLE